MNENSTIVRAGLFMFVFVKNYIGAEGFNIKRCLDHPHPTPPPTPVGYATVRSKAVVQVLFFFCVALWFILRGAICLTLPCSLSSCFFRHFSIVITSLGKEGAGLCVLFVHLFVYFASVNVCPVSFPLGVRD